jgi:3-deoxy-D-manno-octulosonic-acid transferase
VSAAKAAILVKRIRRLNSKGIFFLYRLLQALVSPLLAAYILLRIIRNPKYGSTVRQRLGYLPREYRQTAAGAIWFHAVSVGEVIAIEPLVARMKEHAFISVGTLAGYKTATEKFGAERVFYAPIDYVFVVRRILRAMRPTVLVVAETEIWPNLFREAKRTGCGVVMVNARISDRTTGRYSALRFFFRAALSLPDRILAQTPAMRDRFLKAGAPEDRVTVAGNLKYDSEPQPAPPLPFLAGAKVWIAASTSDDGRIAEEDPVIEAFQKMPGWKLILAPRKPERFEEVARKLEKRGLTFVRRTRMEPGSTADVLLLDTIGELSGLFAHADVVFVGGTLADKGGHNILEPAYFGKPIVIGPHMENFRDIADDFRDAVLQISDPSELGPAILEAAANADLGRRARACAEAKRGAVARATEEIRTVYDRELPRYRRSLPALLLLWPLAQIWKIGGRRRQAKALREQKRLSSRVISIGNLTVGGTGKTPLVVYAARHLKQAGFHPGVLTRGYGRRSPHKLLTYAPGAQAPVTHTGDEPQVILRSGVAAVGIGADRYEVGRLLEKNLNVDIMVLDDGFQHVRLARDLDIVLIDALKPFGECELVPLGRLREPITALARASAFVITRTDAVASTAAIEHVLQTYNPQAPIFRSRVVGREWISAFTDERYPADALPFERTLAFCGLGNPRAFWQSIREAGISPLDCIEYGDHHQYTPREARRLGQLGRALRAEALLTTEKDVVNLCEDTEAVTAPVKLFWLSIAVEIENEAAFLKMLDG